MILARPTIALVVGHKKISQGAIRPDSITEWMFNCEVASLVLTNPKPTNYTIPMGGTYIRDSGSMGDLVKLINSDKPDYVVELHFNSATDTTVQYPAILHCKGSATGEKLAHFIARSDGVWDRAKVQARDTSWNGSELKILTRTHAVAFILEPYFGSGTDYRDWTPERVAKWVIAFMTKLGTLHHGM